MDQYLPGGVFNLDLPMRDEKFDLNEVDHSRFVKPVSDEELKILVENQENVNTKNNTKWVIMNVFNKWCEQHMEDILQQLHEMNADVMNYWLQRFIVEGRRKDGAEYPPKSLYLIACGLLRHLRNNSVYDKNFFDENNVDFSKCLQCFLFFFASTITFFCKIL